MKRLYYTYTDDDGVRHDHHRDFPTIEEVLRFIRDHAYHTGTGYVDGKYRYGAYRTPYHFLGIYEYTETILDLKNSIMQTMEESKMINERRATEEIKVDLEKIKERELQLLKDLQAKYAGAN